MPLFRHRDESLYSRGSTLIGNSCELPAFIYVRSGMPFTDSPYRAHTVPGSLG